MWEIFSVGKNPYPGTDPFTLIKFLDKGGRLSKPPMLHALKKCKYRSCSVIIP